MEKIRFKDLGISEEVKRAVSDLGFEEATAIQTKSIPLLMEGKDVIGHSHTGTGKTASFGIPILEMINPDDKSLQALVLCPTRELAIQACEEIKKYGKYKRGINILPIYGGQQIERQIRSLKRGVQLVIGTPGRVMDHMRRRTLKTGNVRFLVLDEADEMLNMGFREDIETILEDIPNDRQTILFSATMSKEILKITNRYLKEPELVKVVHKKLTVPNIDQFYYEVHNSKKVEALCRLIEINNAKLSLVFCNTKRMVDELIGHLQARGYLVEGLHGDMKQSLRTSVMNRFRGGNFDILVATDVAARGIDVDDIEAVFNYDIPDDEEYYVHRIGRTGRAGRKGSSHSFVSGRRELYKLKDIQKYTSTDIVFKQIPSADEIGKKKITDFADEIKKTLSEDNFNEYISVVEEIMESEECVSLDVAAALVKMLYNQQNENRLDENMSMDDGFGFDKRRSNENRSKGKKHRDDNMARIFINLGRKDRIKEKDIVKAIAVECNVNGSIIGKIDIFGEYSFADVPQDKLDDVLNGMENARVRGKRVSVEKAKKRKR